MSTNTTIMQKLMMASSASANAAEAASAASGAVLALMNTMLDSSSAAASSTSPKNKKRKVTDVTLKAEHVTVMQFLFNEFFSEFDCSVQVHIIPNSTDHSIQGQGHVEEIPVYAILFRGETFQVKLGEDHKDHEDYGKVFIMNKESVCKAWTHHLQEYPSCSFNPDGSYQGHYGYHTWKFVLRSAFGKVQTST